VRVGMSEPAPAPAAGVPAEAAPAYRSPLLERPGAVEADGVDVGVAAHYGEPYAEQRALATGTALVDLSHRPVLRISGEDRLTWLHSLTSQHLDALAPGVATEALVLSPHGHVEHHLALVDDGEAVVAHVEPGTLAPLVAYLDSMRFWSKVEVADVSDALAVVADAAGWRAVPRSSLVSAADAAGSLAGIWAYEALRVEARRPRLGFETDHRTIPHEVGWIGPAVHLDKGCYRGQETVARVHNLGKPPRRLAFLHLDGSVDALPVHGAAVELDGRQVGFVTTAARHHELGPIALALVKRSTPTDVPLLAGGVAAAQD